MTRLLLLGGIAALVLAAVAQANAPLIHFADADDAASVGRGKQIYAAHCAACHGRHLEGQFLWQIQDPGGGRGAPPHDATGHSWMHSDEDLFRMTKEGRFPEWPAGARSGMPAFERRLSDHEILAALSYIKASWPLGIRVSQSLLNPRFRGMPRDAEKVPWTLPPNCTESFKRWKSISR
jgi:mono/diheme cytochrome c family protein